MKVYIVILNYNNEKETKECLESILKCHSDGFDIHTIVVDNYPQNKIKLNVANYRKINLKLKFNPSNLGFAGGVNVGVSRALKDGADYVLILNNDTLVDKNFLAPLLEEFGKDQSVGIVCPKIYYAKGYEYHKNRYVKKDLGKVIWYAGGEISPATVYGTHYGVDEVDRGEFDQLSEVQVATGCCMLVKREVFEKNGQLDDKYFLYYEDADFSIRAKKGNYKIIFNPGSVIWHKNAQSSGGSGSDLQDYYVTRNRLYFGLKYSPIATKVHLIKESLVFLIWGRKWQKRGVLDYYLGIMGKGSYKSA